MSFKNKLNNSLKKLQRPERNLQAGNPIATDTATGDWKQSVHADTAQIARKGYLSVGVAMGAFFIWGTLFPISSAVVSSGKIVSTGQNKLLQHPVGGVVRKISAPDGSTVQKGDLILEIEPASAQAEYTALLARRKLLEGQAARLKASSENNESSKWQEVKTIGLEGFGLRNTLGIDAKQNSTAGKFTAIYDQQKTQYLAGKTRYESELAALENVLRQQQEERDGMILQVKQQTARVALMDEQLAQMRPLVKAGYVAKARLWEAQVTSFDANSQLASFDARADALAASMAETRSNISALKAREDEENARELTEVLAELATVSDEIKAAGKALDSTEIRAPVSGTVVNLTAHTIGGVVSGGDPIGEIVPTGRPLMVETPVMPQDIGELHVNQTAEIVVTALNSRTVEPLTGVVSYVSADSSTNPNTGEEFFTVRIAMEDIPENYPELMSGMQTQAYIQTGSRSFLSYVMTPLTGSIQEAFNEK